MKKATLSFLIKEEREERQICLAMKKRGHGQGKWNGVGGKVNDGETIEEAAIREAREEISVELVTLHKAGEVRYIFPHNTEKDLFVYVFVVDNWKGEPKESDEMNPKWFPVSCIPYNEMWEGDDLWLPAVLERKFIKGEFIFNPDSSVKSYNLDEVNEL